MKQIAYRTIMVLCFVAFLALGTLGFCIKYVAHGAQWAGSSVNSGAYASGRIAKGAIYDANGVLLYDAESGDYADDAAVRKATLHLIGDGVGNISTSAQKALSSHLVGYNPISGIALGGHKLYLTVDSALNATAYAALNGQKGTVAVYNYKTGDLLCMVSAPSFDPMNPPKDIETNSAYDGAYLNRFLSGVYVPGSTFKLVTTAAAAETLEGVFSRSFTCTGRAEVGGETVTCPYAHGEMDLAGALAKSCNCAYAQLAVELGAETMKAYFDQAGLGESLSVSGIHTAKGSYALAETEGSLGWSGVGQYEDLVNPCAMLRLMGGIANGGTGVTPKLIRKETFAVGLPAPSGSGADSRQLWDAATCENLKAMMRNNVISEYGQSLFGDLPACAKSGTAEVGEGKRPHSWFVGFVDDAETPLAFVVVVENGGSGTSVAGSIAAKVVNAAAAGMKTDAAE